jgi:dolichol-phosphate mannosyltransferase
MNAMKLSVIIPAHNEEQNLPLVIEALTARLQAEKIGYEIIVVNDNSSDGTHDVVCAEIRRDPCIRLVDRTPPNGFGRAIRSGLEAVTGDVVVLFMADASDHPQDAVAYYRKIQEGYDCVYGSRFIKGSHVSDYPWLKRIINRIVNKGMQWVFWCPFNDLTNAFKAYRTQVLRECGPLRACHFNITIELSLAAVVRKYHIAQIPISWTGRTWGSSKLHLREMGRRYLSTLLKAFAERLLISDDLLSERLGMQAARETRLAGQERQLAELEQRLGRVERRLGENANLPETASRRAA